MIRISVEVCAGAARFKVGVQAENIRRAVSLVKGRYPGAGTRVVFPLDPGEFFVKDTVAEAGVIGPEMPERLAG